MGIRENPLKNLIDQLNKLEKDNYIYALSIQQSGVNDTVECKYISFKIKEKF